MKLCTHTKKFTNFEKSKKRKIIECDVTFFTDVIVFCKKKKSFYLLLLDSKLVLFFPFFFFRPQWLFSKNTFVSTFIMGMFYFIAVWRELKSITYYPFPSNLKCKIIFASNCSYVFTKQYIKTNWKSENFTVIGLVVFLQRAVNWKAVSYMSFFFYALIIIVHICNLTFFF